MRNMDEKTVEGFGEEWQRFDQSELSSHDKERIFNDYFSLFSWEKLPPNAVGADIGCGSGRWAQLVAPKVGLLHCVDPSQALDVARHNLSGIDNVKFAQASVDDLPFPDNSLDFAYSLGVLHHVPNTAAAIRSIAAKLKPQAPFLLYLYYAFDNRPYWFRLLWRISDILRRTISKMPSPLRYMVSQLLAVMIYWPLARTAKILEQLGCLPANWPLAYYRDKEFYVMRTDALDRFGTVLEHRFTQSQIQTMLETAGFKDVRFSDKQPFWCALAIRS